jgi:hypothetical protein
LVSLDSFFGNQLLISAFLEGKEAEETVFLKMFSREKLGTFRQQSKHFLDCALAFARSRNAIPILSAEAIWRYFSEDAMKSLRDFLESRGLQPRVVGYLRAPWDSIESGFQQQAKVGRTKLWEEMLKRVADPQPRKIVEALDRVFDRDNVNMHFFNPQKFLDQCVVRHFCESNGIAVPPIKIIRENESFNVNALRFIHAHNLHLNAPMSGSLSFLRRAFLIEVLRDLPGPPVRLHRDVTDAYLQSFAEDKSWWCQRLGCDVPVTLVPRESRDGLKCETDLHLYSEDALDWLGRKLGRNVRPRFGQDGSRDVGSALDRLIWRSPTAVARVLSEKSLLRFERARRRRTLLSSHITP